MLEAQCASGQLVVDELDGRRSIFLKNLYGAELFIAQRLKEIAQGFHPWRGLDTAQVIC